jgi:hypothetical protein
MGAIDPRTSGLRDEGIIALRKQRPRLGVIECLARNLISRNENRKSENVFETKYSFGSAGVLVFFRLSRSCWNFLQAGKACAPETVSSITGEIVV